MNAYHAAQKIKRAIDQHYGLTDGPEINRAAAWSRETVQRMGWDPGAHAQVVLEDSEAYEWTIEFTGGDLGPRLARLHQELRAAGIFCEPYNGCILNIYKESS